MRIKYVSKYSRELKYQHWFQHGKTAGGHAFWCPVITENTKPDFFLNKQSVSVSGNITGC